MHPANVCQRSHMKFAKTFNMSTLFIMWSVGIIELLLHFLRKANRDGVQQGNYD
jgi:hypothetical protein